MSSSKPPLRLPSSASLRTDVSFSSSSDSLHPSLPLLPLLPLAAYHQHQSVLLESLPPLLLQLLVVVTIRSALLVVIIVLIFIVIELYFFFSSFSSNSSWLLPLQEEPVNQGLLCVLREARFLRDWLSLQLELPQPLRSAGQATGAARESACQLTRSGFRGYATRGLQGS